MNPNEKREQEERRNKQPKNPPGEDVAPAPRPLEYRVTHGFSYAGVSHNVGDTITLGAAEAAKFPGFIKRT